MRTVTDIPIQSFLEALPSPVLILDVNLYIVSANRAFYRLFQLETAAVEAQPLDKVDFLRAVRPLLEKVIRDNSAVDYEFEQSFPLGVKQLLFHANLIVKDSEHRPMVAVVFDDLTQRKRTEQHFQDLLESAPDAMVIVDQQGKIVLTNAQTQKLFGYSNEELIGQSVEMLVPGRFHPVHEQHRTGYFADPRVRPMGAGMELYGLHKNGREFPVEISLSPLETDEGVLVSAAIRDITERKRIEIELRGALAKERELNELKSRFVSTVSHEFRTPLAGILTSSELLQRYSEKMPPERHNQHLTLIQTQVARLVVLLDDILTYNRVQSVGLEFHPAPLDLASFCATMIDNLQFDPEKYRVEHTFETDSCPQIMADPKLLTQALKNLLENAIKYSPNGGIVGFNVACTEREITFRISDQGIGIPDEDKERLFQLFHRASNVGTIPGTGLGLAIVQESIKAHKGTVTFESEAGQGSTFILVFPLVRQMT